MPNSHLARRWSALALIACPISPVHAQTVHVSRMWHNHQPTYWPEWNTNGSQTNRVEYARDSIVLKPGRSYAGSTAQHPENNLADIFGNDDRRSSYQSGPRNALVGLASSAGFCLSYSGSLIDGVRSLGNASQLGYGPGWFSGNREARTWLTPAGSRRMDLVGFTYHHSLAPLLPKPVLRKEIQTMKQAYWKAWGGNSNLSDHSKGFFPTEMAFSSSIIDVLAEEGYQWSIVASHHLSRTCPTYMNRGTIADNRGIFSSLPNKADLLGPSPSSGWWYGQPNPGNAAWNVSPFAYQLHRAKYINPASGAESSILLVPSDDVLSYRFGYAAEGIDKIQSNIAPFATDPSRPVMVMPSTDGDNAWGGGSSSWFEATPAFFNAAGSAGYVRSAVQDFVNAHAAAADTVHIEDGAWIFPESCYGSANFLKWIEPPLAATAATRYANTLVDLETPGFALKFWSWAPIITGANWCETAEQILRDEGGTVQPWKIQAPYDWDGTWTAPNEVELAWHIYLHGLDSGFNYYGGLGNDDEVKASLATTRTIQKLQPWMTNARRANDRTAPTILKPQRFPYNPGTHNFGWFNNSPVQPGYLKLMPSEFYVWTHAYDISGVATVHLKVRIDGDGTNSMASNHNETYAGGSDVGSWVSIPMTLRNLPNTPSALNAAANNGQINYFITPPELADYYYAKVSNTNLSGFRGKLIDYYIEATDTKNNSHKSDIQHVFVEDDGVAATIPATPAGLSAVATGSTAISVSWRAVPGSSGYHIYRNGALSGTTQNTVWADTGLIASTTYSYTVSAYNAAGQSAVSAPVSASTLTGAGNPTVVPFVMDGFADSTGYRISNPGMTIHAALRGSILYLATWAPGAFANDHFILVGNAALTSPASPAPWGKAGFTALPAGSPFLAAESSNSYIGWFNANGAATTTARAAGQQMEGTINLSAAYGGLPADLYLTAPAYQTGDSGLLGSQAPAMIADNGNVDPGELLRIPLEALRDEDANGTYDRLEAGKGFAITAAGRVANVFSLTWKCFPGRSYQIQSSDTLLADSWIAVPGGTVTAGATALEASHAIPLDAGDSQGFFRVMLLP